MQSNMAEQPLMEYEGLEEAFPDVDPGLIPYGARVLVQIRTPKRETVGGIILPEEIRETELWNTQIAKVISLGPVAFKNRDTLESWPEGDWCQPGTYIRCPKYGGDRWKIPVPGTNENALFTLYRDLDIIGEVKGNPLDIVAYL